MLWAAPRILLPMLDSRHPELGSCGRAARAAVGFNHCFPAGAWASIGTGVVGAGAVIGIGNSIGTGICVAIVIGIRIGL